MLPLIGGGITCNSRLVDTHMLAVGYPIVISWDYFIYNSMKILKKLENYPFIQKICIMKLVIEIF